MNGSVSVNPIVPLIGRILVSGVFLVVGIRSAMAFSGFAGYLGKLGFPAAQPMAVLAIAAMLVGAVLLIIGLWTRWAAALLVVFLLIAIFSAHRFWEYDAAQYANQLNHFLKDVGLIGSMLYIIAFGPGPLSVDKK